jgi:hypothetical protein
VIGEDTIAKAEELHVFTAPVTGPSRATLTPANPTRHELLVELVALVDVEVTHIFLFRLAWEKRTQRCAAEERHLDVGRGAIVLMGHVARKRRIISVCEGLWPPRCSSCSRL